MGHRRIAFIHGEPTAVTRNRLAGFRKACEELEIEIPNGYVLCGRFHDPKASSLCTQALLQRPDRPSCILYPDDISILGGMTVIERANLRIPEDISVAGYDGIPLSRMLRPRLTTLEQDSERLGTDAVAFLLEAIEDPKNFVPRLQIIPGRLQTGGTVGPAPE